MIFGIETATTSCSVTIYDDINSKIISTKTLFQKNIHSENLLQITDDIICEAKINLSQIKKIAVSIGPGSFTGLRIGLSAAKGLATALEIPITAIPTIDGLIYTAALENKLSSNSKIMGIIYAGRDEVFCAKYDFNNKMRRNSQYEIKPIIDILNSNSDYQLILSNEWNEPDKKFPSDKITVITCSSISIAQLATENEYTVYNNFEDLEPMYIRSFEAKLNK
ncbi:MAG: tRNA (adenosine(37)-N6)-threonylcarbamoyltransferase complex dimerization subunit type 1 TsaB [Bacteroidetes bacterium]|nr:tRNA (adenosine(37)-N6)-threonylcarbamoyltransferase complex dimerization subunit type 1 TsaB [Bacteroidota bacterium]